MNKICSQCGQPWDASACGPTHAMIQAEKKVLEAGSFSESAPVSREAWAGLITEKKADCPGFRESVTNPEICAKWIKIPHKDPFCQVEDKCPSMGLRLTPRADQESDSEE